MDFYNFRCAYEIADDKTYSIMIIHSNEGSDEADVYTVNKHTGAIDFKYYELYSNCMYFQDFIFTKVFN